jgi:signal transduction histidine kinase
LGLAIVERLVEAMDGTVSARSGEGGGAVFEVSIPARTG